MDDRIRSVLEEAVPECDIEAVRPTGPSWNEKNRTVAVDFADGERIYLKTATDGDGPRIARERAGELPDDFEARRPVYEAVRFLGVSGFVDEWAAYLDEPADELSEWIAEEMDRRLAAIR